MRRIFLLLGATALLLTMLVPAFAGAAEKKVTICHVPPGNPGNAHTITVGESALAAHLGHGDYPGKCKKDDGGKKVVYAKKDGKCVQVPKGDSKKYDKVYSDKDCTQEKFVWVKKDDKKHGKCIKINKAESSKYATVYKDDKCKKELHKKH